MSIMCIDMCFETCMSFHIYCYKGKAVGLIRGQVSPS